MEDKQSSNVDQLALERDRLKFERQKFAIEVRLKRRELAKGGKSWKELLANPLTLAIVGGFITVMSTLVTTSYTANENRRLEEERAKQARASEDLRAKYASDSAKHALQAELIKKFVEAPRTETVRGNLKFLVDVGLLPDYGPSIEKYLKENPDTAPALGNTTFTEIGFEVQAPYLLRRLVRDFDLQDFQAAGIVGNIAEETKGFSFLRERPSAGDSAVGGRGYFSWTGPRRGDFENFTREKGLDPNTVEANYAFLKQELETTEKAALTELKKTSTIEDATRVFMNRVLRPSIANLPSRISFAERALGLYKAQIASRP